MHQMHPPPIIPPIFDNVLHPWPHSDPLYSNITKRWYQDGRELKDVKTHKAFVWPRDGKRKGTWGRFKDIMQDKGPDIHVVFSARKNDHLANRPMRWKWAGQPEYLAEHQNFVPSLSSRRYAPWVKKPCVGGREEGKEYDFRTRRYWWPNNWMWTNAVWQQNVDKSAFRPWPEAIRDAYGNWYENLNFRPPGLGGPLFNEIGAAA